MSDLSAHPDIEVSERPGGICYRLRFSKPYQSPVSCYAAYMAAFPLVLGGVAGVFLVQHYEKLSWSQVALSWLFVAHMVFLARLPLRLLWGSLFHRLATWYGCVEVEIRGNRFLTAKRVGPIRSVGVRWPVQSVRRVIVYVYRPKESSAASGKPEETAMAAATEPDQGCLALDCDGAKPLPLLVGWPREVMVALAEDLHRRLTVAIWSQEPARHLSPVETIETTEKALEPDSESTTPLRLRVVYWLVWNLGGAAGWFVLWTTVRKTAGPSILFGFMTAGFVVELFCVFMNITFARQAFGKPNTKPNPPPPASG
jgi:hypothetical protein